MTDTATYVTFTETLTYYTTLAAKMAGGNLQLTLTCSSPDGIPGRPTISLILDPTDIAKIRTALATQLENAAAAPAGEVGSRDEANTILRASIRYVSSGLDHCIASEATE